ncbi:unnamed protein product [Urochloa humidicola]
MKLQLACSPTKSMKLQYRERLSHGPFAGERRMNPRDTFAGEMCASAVPPPPIHSPTWRSSSNSLTSQAHLLRPPDLAYHRAPLAAGARGGVRTHVGPQVGEELDLARPDRDLV